MLATFSAIFNEKIEIRERCKGVHCVDLGESFPTSIYLQNLASIQPRTSPTKTIPDTPIPTPPPPLKPTLHVHQSVNQSIISGDEPEVNATSDADHVLALGANLHQHLALPHGLHDLPDVATGLEQQLELLPEHAHLGGRGLPVFLVPLERYFEDRYTKT